MDQNRQTEKVIFQHLELKGHVSWRDRYSISTCPHINITFLLVFSPFELVILLHPLLKSANLMLLKYHPTEYPIKHHHDCLFDAHVVLSKNVAHPSTWHFFHFPDD